MSCVCVMLGITVQDEKPHETAEVRKNALATTLMSGRAEAEELQKMARFAAREG